MALLYLGRKARLLGSIAVVALVAAFVIAGPTFAVDTPVFDFSGDVDVTGFIAGIAAAIAAVFVTAVGLKLMFRAARITLRALGFISA
jgi:hypothetical protein